MNRWLLALLLVFGLATILGVSAAVVNGDNTGETVSPSRWADDVCGVVGAWEGQFEVVRDELDQSNYGARRSDGSPGDSVERTPGIRVAINRAIRATGDTLREGLKRSGFPDAPRGQAASLILRAWAFGTELRLVAAKQTLRTEPATTSQAYEAVAAATAALEQSAIRGRAAFQRAAALDPAIADALNGSNNCQELRKEQP